MIMEIETLINDEVLKPCPFCGREVTLISSSRSKQFVFNHKGLRNCPFYRFELPWEYAKSLKEATELWNRREDKHIADMREPERICDTCKYKGGSTNIGMTTITKCHNSNVSVHQDNEECKFYERGTK